MKKWIFILSITAAVGFCGNSLALAEETHETGTQSRGQGMMGMGGQGKGGGMMGMMQKDTVVATSDGGVVVLAGPRLLKYDKDLTLIKEVELPRGKKPGQGQNPEVGMPPQEEQAPLN